MHLRDKAEDVERRYIPSGVKGFIKQAEKCKAFVRWLSYKYVTVPELLHYVKFVNTKSQLSY